MNGGAEYLNYNNASDNVFSDPGAFEYVDNTDWFGVVSLLPFGEGSAVKV